MKRAARAVVWLGLLGVCGAAGAVAVNSAGGCARPGEKFAESALKELLPKTIGPADRWDVQVKTDSLGALTRGRLRAVRIDGAQVRIAPDLTLATLHIEADEVEVDRRAQTLTRVGSARFSARINDTELDRFARVHRPKVASLGVALRANRVQVTLVPELLGRATVPVTIDGNVWASPDGATLDFVPDEARLSIVPIPKAVLNYASERVNPILDLRNLTLPVRVTSAKVHGSQLWIEGTIPPDEIVRLAR